MLSASLCLPLSPSPQFQFQFQFKPHHPHPHPHPHLLRLPLPLPRSYSFSCSPPPPHNKNKRKSNFPSLSCSSLQFTDTDSDRDSNASTADHFLRYTTTSPLPHVAAQLQASIVTYNNTLPSRLLNPSLHVDLISAIHIADKQYFDILQDRLATYDCVLYEGVADRDNPDTHMEGYSITSLIQRLVARILSLDFQLDCINYKCPNWYNADLDWDTFERLQDQRGETLLGLAANALRSAFQSDVDSSSAQSGFHSFRSNLLRVSWIIPMPLSISFIISQTCSPDYDGNTVGEFSELEFSELGIGSALKVILARPMISMFASELFKDLEGSVIIGERNKAALEELKKAIARGEKRVAIFYGAGHMPDMGRRLRRDFNMVPTDVEWVTAWAIRKTDSKFLSPFFEKYLGRFLPFLKEMGGMLIFCSVLLLDLWLWWSATRLLMWVTRLGFRRFGW